MRGSFVASYRRDDAGGGGGAGAGGVVVGGWFVGAEVGVAVVVGPVPFGGVLGGHASRVGSQFVGLGVPLLELWHPAAMTIAAARASIERIRDLSHEVRKWRRA